MVSRLQYTNTSTSTRPFIAFQSVNEDNKWAQKSYGIGTIRLWELSLDTFHESPNRIWHSGILLPVMRTRPLQKWHFCARKITCDFFLYILCYCEKKVTSTLNSLGITRLNTFLISPFLTYHYHVSAIIISSCSKCPGDQLSPCCISRRTFGRPDRRKLHDPRRRHHRSTALREGIHARCVRRNHRPRHGKKLRRFKTRESKT